MIEKLKQDKFLLLTIALIVFHVLQNSIWIFLNQVPPADDAAYHTFTTFRFTEYLMYHFSEFDWQMFLTISHYYAPLTQLIGMAIGFIDPYNYKLIQFTGTLFFALAMVFLYLYTKENTKNSAVGFLTVFFFSFFLYLFKESRDHMTDIPLVFFFLAGLYFLKLSDNFKNVKHTVLFFLCFALACLTRWTAPVYFLIPIIFQVIPIFKSLLSDKKAWIGLVLGLFLFVMILFPWYSTNYKNIIEGAFTFSAANKDNPVNNFSLESIFFYPRLILMFQIGLLGFILLCATLVPNFIHMRKRFFWEIIATLVFCYLIFTFVFGNKIIRYIFPMMPFLAILLGNGARLAFTRYHFLNPLAALAMVFAVFSYFVLSFGIPFYPNYKHAVNITMAGWTDIFYLHHDPVKAIFDRDDWKGKEMASILIQRKTNSTVWYFTNITKPYLNGSTIGLYLYALPGGIEANYHEAFGFFLDGLHGRSVFANTKEIEDFVNKVDVLFISEKQIGPGAALKDEEPRIQVRDYMLNNLAPNHSEIRIFSLPDGDRVHVYQRKEEI